MKTAEKFIGYLGAGLMIGFNFTLYIPAGILGLSLLCLQAIRLKAYNLLALNIVGIIGLFYSLFVK